MKLFHPLLALLAAFTLTNCSSSSPTGRIEKNPQIYNDLSLREQELVSQGQIDEGMSPGGVYLALGSPDRRLEGSAEGKRTMRWDYTGLYPVYTNNFYGHFGSGYGRYGRRYGGLGFGPTVNYVPVRSSTVWFENDQVRSFERVR
ncbi:MAG: hypothetical protein ACSHYB_01110 [Roseibacillus sp.]